MPRLMKGISSLARHYNRDRSTVYNWLKLGLPRRDDKWFDLDEVEAWLRRRQGIVPVRAPLVPGGSLEGSGQVKGKDFWDKENKRLQAENRKLELRRRRAELVDRGEVEAVIHQACTIAKNEALSFERSLPPLLAHKDEREIQALIAREIRDWIGAYIKRLEEFAKADENTS